MTSFPFNRPSNKVLNRIPLWIAAALLASLGGVGKTDAGELQPKHLPADAKWVIHVDYEGLSQSAMWNKIRDEKDSIRDMVQGWMSERYGIDLPGDLKAITMFSDDYQEYTGTVIVQAKYDASKIETRLKDAPKYKSSKSGDHTLHTFEISKPMAGKGGQGEKDSSVNSGEMTVVLVDDNTLLLASSESQAKDTLKLLSGDAESLEGKDTELLGDQFKSAWVYAAAIDLGELKQHPVAMPIITQHKRIEWSIGKQGDGNLYEQAELVAQSPEVAEKMKKVIEGVIAYQSLWAEGSEPLTKLMKNVEVQQQGDTASFMWSGSSDQVVAALDDVIGRMKEWKK